MNTRTNAKTKWMLYKELELIPDTIEEPKFNWINIRTHVSKIWNALIDLFTRGSEPQIWLTSDQTGNPCWRVYDPVTNESCCFSSESELRVWFEDRYYRHTNR